MPVSIEFEDFVGDELGNTLGLTALPECMTASKHLPQIEALDASGHLVLLLSSGDSLHYDAAFRINFQAYFGEQGHSDPHLDSAAYLVSLGHQSITLRSDDLMDDISVGLLVRILIFMQVFYVLSELGRPDFGDFDLLLPLLRILLLVLRLFHTLLIPGNEVILQTVFSGTRATVCS